MRNRLMTALCVLLSLAPGLVILPDRPSVAQEEQVCHSSWAARAAAAAKNGWTVRELEPAERDRFVAALNDEEPKTDYRVDHVYVGARGDLPYGVVDLVVGNDCDVVHGVLDLEDIERMARGAAGADE